MSRFGKSNGGGRRSAQRATAPLIAVVTTLKGSQSTVLVDVSDAGARLQGRDLPRKGEELFLATEEVVAFGSIVWSDGDARGMRFDEPLRPGEYQFLRQRVTQAAGLPPHIKAAFEDWTIGVAR